MWKGRFHYILHTAGTGPTRVVQIQNWNPPDANSDSKRAVGDGGGRRGQRTDEVIQHTATLQKESSMPTLTIVNSCDIPVVVTLNNKDTTIPAGGQIARTYNGRVHMRAKPSGKQAGMFKASEPAAQDMVRDIDLTVAVIDDDTAKLGFT
jgi:hypothetical protein